MEAFAYFFGQQKLWAKCIRFAIAKVIYNLNFTEWLQIVIGSRNIFLAILTDQFHQLVRQGSTSSWIWLSHVAKLPPYYTMKEGGGAISPGISHNTASDDPSVVPAAHKTPRWSQTSGHHVNLWQRWAHLNCSSIFWMCRERGGEREKLDFL